MRPVDLLEGAIFGQYWQILKDDIQSLKRRRDGSAFVKSDLEVLRGQIYNFCHCFHLTYRLHMHTECTFHCGIKFEF